MNTKLRPFEVAQAFCVVLGVAAGAFASLSLLLETFENNLIRWGAWLLPALLFFASALVEPMREHSVMRDENGIRMQRLAPRWLAYISGGIAFSSFLLADLLFVYCLEPIFFKDVLSFQGGLSGYTLATASEEPIMQESITLIEAAQDCPDPVTESRYPFAADARFQRPWGTELVVITGIRLEVVRFAEMSAFYADSDIGGVGDFIDASFTIKQREWEPTEDTPWKATLDSVTDGGAPLPITRLADADLLNIRLEDYDIRWLRYSVGAATSGIYWVKLYLDVEHGYRDAESFEVTKQPIPLAFYSNANPYEKDSPVIGGRIKNESEQLRDSINQSERWLSALRNGEVIPCPARPNYSVENDIAKRTSDLQFLKRRLVSVKESESVTLTTQLQQIQSTLAALLINNGTEQVAPPAPEADAP